jgi:Glycosyltransferase family 9 (heptosyltransferase)
VAVIGHRHPAPSSPGTVLVLRALGLGDAVTGIAALRGIRRAWPASRLVLAGPGWLGGWLRGLGIVDEVLHATGLAVALRPAGAVGHIAVNLHGRGPDSHRVLRADGPERLVAFRNPEAGHDDGPEWRADEHEVVRWCRLVTAAGGSCDVDDLRLPRLADRHDGIVVHPGAAAGSRRWPASRWRAVVRALTSRGHRVILTGGPGERSQCAQVGDGQDRVWDLSGKLSVPALADLIAGTPLLLCGDTGPAHLATAYGTPSVLLFGPTPPDRWGPVIDPHLHTVLWHGDAGRGDPHTSEIDSRLAAIEVDEVLRAAAAMLESREPVKRQSAERGGSSAGLLERVGEP